MQLQGQTRQLLLQRGTTSRPGRGRRQGRAGRRPTGTLGLLIAAHTGILTLGARTIKPGPRSDRPPSRHLSNSRGTCPPGSGPRQIAPPNPPSRRSHRRRTSAPRSPDRGGPSRPSRGSLRASGAIQLRHRGHGRVGDQRVRTWPPPGLDHHVDVQGATGPPQCSDHGDDCGVHGRRAQRGRTCWSSCSPTLRPGTAGGSGPARSNTEGAGPPRHVPAPQVAPASTRLRHRRRPRRRPDHPHQRRSDVPGPAELTVVARR